LRASDLLRITAEQVDGLKPGDEIELKEKKTGKIRRITLNKACIKAIEGLLAEGKHEPQDILFKGQRGPLTVPSVHRLVKSWCAQINLKGNYGSHTLRKTFGYHQRVTFGVSLPILMQTFNHSSQRQTLDYLCVQDEEIKSIYENEL
jgi:integrase